MAYCEAKKIKDSSNKRYDSIFRTHFGDWLDRPVVDLGVQSFSEHCHAFAQSKGNALVEVGRGIVCSRPSPGCHFGEKFATYLPVKL